MKNKKLLTAILSVATAATLTASVFSGCAQEEHRYVWTVNKEATCMETGTRTGVCNLHGDVTTEVIPVDPNNHGYDDWIVEKPTETKTGKATKICRYNNSHTVEVELPVLSESGEGYLSNEVTQRPTSIAEGVQTYIFEHEIENVKFEIPVPKRGKESLEDAVYIGWANADKVRSRSGTSRDSAVAGAQINNFSYEFGDNFTHILDGANNMEYWYSVDGAGNAFGVGKRGNEEPAVDLTTTEKKLQGYQYQSGGGTFVTYGAEDALYQYYEIARISRERGNCVKYKEEGGWNNDGSFVGGFSYSYYENPHFCRYKIEFSLDSNGILMDLKVQTSIIRSYMIAEDEKGGKLFYSDGDMVFAEQYYAYNELPGGDPNYTESTEPVYERDEKGNVIYEGYKTNEKGQMLYAKPMDLQEGEVYDVLTPVEGQQIRRPKPYIPSGYSDAQRYYSDEHEEVSIRTVQFNAPVLKREGEVVPTNPYTPDKCYIQSFDARYSGAVLGETRVSIPSNTEVRINMENIQPATALLSYDPIEIYVRTSDGDRLVTQNASDNEYRVTGYCDSVRKQISLKVLYAGDITLILRSRGGAVEKLINLTVTKGAPTQLFSQAYAYSDDDGTESYDWRNYAAGSSVPLYVGQTVLLRATASDSELLYVDTTVSGECEYVPDPSRPLVTAPNPNIHFETVEKDGEKVVSAYCDKAGEYEVTLRSTKGGTYSTIQLVVSEAPQPRDLFKGVYTGHLNFVGENGDPADLKVTFDFTTDYRNGTIVVDLDGSTMNFTYKYDAATKTLTSERRKNDGLLTGGTYDFSFGLNEAYKFTLTHTSSFGTPEKIVLSPFTEE